VLLSAEEIAGVYAIVPTPSKDGADHWSATDTVDLAESRRLVNQLIDDGAAGIIAMGTTGECATLTEGEWRQFTEVVVSTAAERVPTFIGATTMGTHPTVERLRFARDVGATGTLLGLPMWQPCTEDMAVRFYADISEAFPDLSVMIYMNQRAFRFEFPVSFWSRVVEAAPTVTSAKYTRSPSFSEMVSAVKGRVNLMPMDATCFGYAQEVPEAVTGCWTTAASMGPHPSIAIMKALADKDMVLAKAINEDIVWATETFMPPDPAEFGFYNIQLEKIRMDSSGYSKAGPIRPPYNIVPAEYEARARECGRRWAELERKYSGA
jgi:trans-o-hydroxybenzylidenepyruvate hydratase-aldolase